MTVKLCVNYKNLIAAACGESFVASPPRFAGGSEVYPIYVPRNWIVGEPTESQYGGPVPAFALLLRP